MVQQKKQSRLAPQNVLLVLDARIPKNERRQDLYYYQMRHGESDWDTPITIEKFVAFNFYGILITHAPLKLAGGYPGERPYLKLNLTEREYLRARLVEKIRSKQNV